jgi:hypothetical protein
MWFKQRPNLFESRTEVWREVGLGGEVDRAQAKRAGGGVIITLALIVGVLVLFSQRRELFPGMGTEVRIATVVLLVMLGWALARSVAQDLAPALFRRLDPATAGTVGFLPRLLTIVASVIAALRIAGVQPEALAVGGAFTAIVLGLAAQQTIVTRRTSRSKSSIATRSSSGTRRRRRARATVPSSPPRSCRRYGSSPRTATARAASP